MAKIRLSLDKRRQKSNGTYSLVFRISHFNDTRLLQTGLDLFMDEWDNKDQEIRKRPDRAFLNSDLHQKLAAARTYLAQQDQEIQRLPINILKDRIIQLFQEPKHVVETKSDSLVEYTKILFDRTLLSGRYKTAIWYKESVKSILKYCGAKDLSMSAIDVGFLENFTAHCMGKGHSKNTISVRLRGIRAIMNKARRESSNYLAADHKPFENFKIPTQKTPKRAVSKDVIQKLRAFEIEQGTNMWHYRNYFLFMFNMQGMNFVDIAKLRVKQIEKGRLKYIRSKTHRPYDLKLTTEALTIIQVYLTDKSKNDFVFPIIPENDLRDPIKISKQADEALHVFNRNLKKLGKQCGIEEKLTSYVARHTWASAAKKLGVSTDVIGEALGHSDYRVTEIYLQEFDRDVIDKANELVTS